MTKNYTLDETTQLCAEHPSFAVYYFAESKSHTHSRALLRHLYNHASRPLPSHLAQNGDDVEIAKSKIASLVYSAARKAGGGYRESSKLWMKARFGL